MTEEELKETLDLERLRAFNHMKLIVGPGFTPATAGFKNVGDALEHTMKHALKRMEKILLKWERDNPSPTDWEF